ncbi:class I adenylate-forming enzyme family protein [Mycobacterium stomatepiae]|uniref:Long-chain-fatty-acid--CoA ligase n=1 Tax=Mycobacterium stomatepiae TaxID=470076 RepID=A0A7I7QFW0_9MYCO|nr:AMP-binding protein [Mycobacterium stomatepiae]MCV7164651.1 AMP-binding protein [Mycobacterium stomatepiae]BBY25111.1 long-chain-fatty-acid--CoA ligase [Mycobacterium stomatepiae]
MPEAVVGASPSIGPGEIFPCAASRDADGLALITDTVRLTYGDLERLSRNFAVALQRRGIATGDVVSLFGQNAWQWMVAYHGALRAGAVVNPINVMLTAPELAHVLGDCRSRALIIGAERSATAYAALATTPDVALVAEYGGAQDEATEFDELLADGARHPMTMVDARPNDLCAIVYTSGTTGHPKGAMQSHQAVLLNCALTATMHTRSRSDIVVTALPVAHVYGNVAINSTFLAGGTVVLMERFDADRTLYLIAAERATMFEGVPTMYSKLLAAESLDTADLRSLRMCTVGGQAFSAKQAEDWRRRSAVPLIELWGMTELAGLGATHSPLCPSIPGSIGVSLPGIDVRIAALDGSCTEVPPGQLGELQVRGPIVMSGYHGNPETTREALDTDGWLGTGDIGYRDAAGRLFVVDRIKHMIITSGYNVYPAEIERVISAHPDVALVGVAGRPDAIRGEIAVAYVVARTRRQPTAESIMEFCRDRLAACKRPRAVEFVTDLPMTSSGKIMRRRLTQARPATHQIRGDRKTAGEQAV